MGAALGLCGIAQTERPLVTDRPKVCRPEPEPRNYSEQARWEEWPGYQERLAEMTTWLPKQPDGVLQMPVRGIRVRQVADTFWAPRPGGRRHEGQDIFASRGTPVYAATEGYILRMAYGPLGGMQIYVLGAGGRRYYYAHFDRFNPNLEEGQWVTPETVLGYVGNTGIARTTPHHLHFGIYVGSRLGCDYRALNPLPLMKDRNWQSLQAVVGNQGQ